MSDYKHDAERHSARFCEIGSAVTALSGLVIKNQDRLTGKEDEQTCLNDSDIRGLMLALKLLGQSSLDYGEDILESITMRESRHDSE